MNSTLGIVFPGQGSQSVGMLADLASFPMVQQTFEEASAILGYDLWQLTQEGPAQTLDQTVHTQPALLAASYALWQLLQAKKPLQPALLAGHSLGEYTALVCAKALKFSDAIQLVAARGQYMQEAVAAGTGAMAAIIGLDDNTVEAICKRAMASDQEVISPANYNSLGQVVVAGHKAPVERAMILAKEEGAKLAVLIPVSVPSHCALMHSAAIRLEARLNEISIQQPHIPVVNNIEARPYESIDAIRKGLVKQLSMPVRWVNTIQYFIQSGVTTIMECGPGKVLTGLNKRIDKHLQFMTLSDAAHLNVL
jgi:[acyl-carrier-protein] S-malonyltransferase